MITGIAHINLTVPEGSLHLADEFYRDTLGLKKVPVPRAQENSLAWYVIARSRHLWSRDC
jgi:catechol 2,3-dioxygenase-like lactoylglutathione lyase family enzyme